MPSKATVRCLPKRLSHYSLAPSSVIMSSSAAQPSSTLRSSDREEARKPVSCCTAGTLLPKAEETENLRFTARICIATEEEGIVLGGVWPSHSCCVYLCLTVLLSGSNTKITFQRGTVNQQPVSYIAKQSVSIAVTPSLSSRLFPYLQLALCSGCM